MKSVRKPVVVITAALLGIVLSLAVFGWVSRLENDRLALQFAQLSEARVSIIEREIEAHLNELHALRRFWENSDEVTEHEFRHFVAPIRVRHLDFAGFVWAPRVLDADRFTFEEKIRGAGNEEYAIRETSPAGDMVEAGRREQYFPILFREPPHDSLGWDLLSEPERSAAVALVRETGLAVITGPTDCIGRPGREPSVIFCEPVFKALKGNDRGESPRSSELMGVIASSMDLGGIMEEVTQTVLPAGIHYLIQDVTGGTPGVPLHFHVSRTEETDAGEVEALRGSPLVFTKSLDVAGRRWLITCTPAPYFLDQHGSNTRWVGLAAGLFLTVFFVGWLQREQSRAAGVESLVELRTEALKESEEHLELALHGADLGVWDWNVQSDDVAFNERWVTMLGYEVGEIEPHSSSWGKLVHPEDLADVEAVLQAHLDGRRDHYEAEYRMRSKSGSWVWILDRGRVVQRDQEGRPLRVAGTHLDITDRKEAEKRIDAANRALLEEQSLFKKGPAVIFKWLRGPEWSVEYVSENALDVIGYDVQSWISGEITYSGIVFPEDLERVRKEVASFTDLGVSSFEHKPYRLVRKDGGIIWVADFTTVWRDPDGEPAHYLGYVLDITERKRAEEQKQEAEARVRHAQKLEGLGVLAGGIAHDFNNILTGILGNADLALHELGPQAPVRRNVEEIVSASLHAAGLARQMLAYSGKGSFVVGPIDINRIVREMSDLLRAASSKKVVFRCEFGDDLPSIDGDETQIRQIVLNLVTNASEAIGDENGVIVLRTGKQSCDREFLRGSYLHEDQEEGPYIFLEVSDTGCGMDEKTKSRMFDPFFTTKFAGRGLGMAAVLGIVRGHGGAIKIDTEEGTGTTIRFLFPVVESEAGVTEALDPRPGLQEWSGSGTILVVDDDAMIRGLATRMLEHLGFEVITASDGQEAVEIFKDRAQMIACVLLDLTMPRMGGEEAFAEMRGIRADVPVILSSGYNKEVVAEEISAKGLAGFVQKPYVLETLAHVLKKVLGP